jgi:hypothetical protein
VVELHGWFFGPSARPEAAPVSSLLRKKLCLAMKTSYVVAGPDG